MNHLLDDELSTLEAAAKTVRLSSVHSSLLQDLMRVRGESAAEVVEAAVCRLWFDTAQAGRARP